MKKIQLKKMLLLTGIVVVFIVTFQKCSFHSLPKEKLQAIVIGVEENFVNNEYQLVIKNPAACPTRFFLSSEDELVNQKLGEISPVVLNGFSDTSIVIQNKGDLRGKIDISFKWGNPELAIETTKLECLPYPIGKSYELLQGNNSYPTHNSSVSRFAYDFTMEIGDTIVSTQDGFVVSVVDGYSGWGTSNKWKSFGNQIMIYDTTSHLFTMYGHLTQNGSLVEFGEYVTIGQHIALSGKTGQTSVAHLHFNVLQADNGSSGLKSYPLDSIGNYKVSELKRYQLMRN